MNIGIIGGGNGGKGILKSLLKIEGVKIQGLVDIKEDAPAVKTAKEHGIFTTKEMAELFEKPLDLIIEVTGNDKVKSKLHELNTKNVNVMCSLSAELMMHLVEQQEALNASLEENVHEVNRLSDNLEEFIENTLENIKRSDELVRYMNKVTNQTNILGLNASIEASRAGEAGRGFAVVAKEVQSLAQNSEKLALQINDILSRIGGDVENTFEMVKELKKASEENKA